jgi:hypothetical protein
MERRSDMTLFLAYLAGLVTLPLGWFAWEFAKQSADLWSGLDYYDSPDNRGNLTWFGRISMRIMRLLKGRRS